ncbi:MAG TPA: DUF362 domain-containing protein [Polyangia bacterium]|nr:DUF362 domain-containing protein [Polyangia bacterium]
MPRIVPAFRRRVLVMGGAAAALGAIGVRWRGRIRGKLSQWTALDSFVATPVLKPHDPAGERRTLFVARGESPASNVDAALGKLGGIGRVVGETDVVLIKVSAQWWNQGMTNVAAVKRVIEHVLERPGFRGEIVVFENVHFRLADGSPLARAWTHPSARNVDIDGARTMGALISHFESRKTPVSFVGLVDAGPSALAGDPWHDPGHVHGVYGGDGRGPIAPGEDRDGYVWDFSQTFRLRRSLLDHAQTLLTWPVFTSPRSGLVVDFRDGLHRREGGRRVAVSDRKLTWINMTTANEHASTGFTGAVKSPMGIVDMSAGRLGADRRVQDFQSVHYFGAPRANWRMAGPLAQFSTHVRHPDLYLTVAHWMAATPRQGWPGGDEHDIRLEATSAFPTRALVAGTDPVAIDTWCIRNLLMPIGGAAASDYNLDDPDAKVVKFLRYWRQTAGWGTLDESLVTAT